MSTLEQLFSEALDRLEMPAVGKEQDHMVAFLHYSVMVRHQDIIAAHNGADGGTFRELDLLHGLSNDP